MQPPRSPLPAPHLHLSWNRRHLLFGIFCLALWTPVDLAPSLSPVPRCRDVYPRLAAGKPGVPGHRAYGGSGGPVEPFLFLALMLMALPCLVLRRREEPATQRNAQRGGIRPVGAPGGEQGTCKAGRLICGFSTVRCTSAGTDVPDGSVRGGWTGGEPGLEDGKPRVLQSVFLPGGPQ